MKLYTATILPIVLVSLATNCNPGDDSGGGAGGAADAGENAHGADAGDPAAGATHSSGSAGDGAGGEPDDGSGEDAGGEGGKDAGEAGRGETANGGASTGGNGAGGAAAGESPAGAAGVPEAPGGQGGMGAGEAVGGSSSGEGGSGDETPTLHAVAWLQADSCERFVPFEVRDVRYGDGTPVTDYTCAWTFSEGGSVHETCTGTVVQGWGETFRGTVIVRDSATGATTTATTDTVQQIEPLALEVWAFADNCMEFSYEVDRQYGCGGAHTIDIQPSENILTPGPWSIHGGILQVATPGVYTVTYNVEGCAPQFERTCITTDVAHVTVEECPYP